MQRERTSLPPNLTQTPRKTVENMLRAIGQRFEMASFQLLPLSLPLPPALTFFPPFFPAPATILTLATIVSVQSMCSISSRSKCPCVTPPSDNIRVLCTHDTAPFATNPSPPTLRHTHLTACAQNSPLLFSFTNSNRHLRCGMCSSNPTPRHHPHAAECRHAPPSLEQVAYKIKRLGSSPDCSAAAPRSSRLAFSMASSTALPHTWAGDRGRDRSAPRAMSSSRSSLSSSGSSRRRICVSVCAMYAREGRARVFRTHTHT